MQDYCTVSRYIRPNFRLPEGVRLHSVWENSTSNGIGFWDVVLDCTLFRINWRRKQCRIVEHVRLLDAVSGCVVLNISPDYLLPSQQHCGSFGTVSECFIAGKIHDAYSTNRWGWRYAANEQGFYVCGSCKRQMDVAIRGYNFIPPVLWSMRHVPHPQNSGSCTKISIEIEFVGANWTVFQ